MVQLVKMPDIPVIPFSLLCFVAELNAWKLIYFLLDWDYIWLKKKIKKINSIGHCIIVLR